MGIPEHKKMEGEVLKSYNLPYKDFTHYRCFGDGQVSCDELRKQKKLIEEKYWSKREEYWLDKLKNILMVVFYLLLVHVMPKVFPS
jgi:hypothetical protein